MVVCIFEPSTTQVKGTKIKKVTDKEIEVRGQGSEKYE